MRELLVGFEDTFHLLKGQIGAPILPIGYFANVLNLGNIGLAVSSDGVGTKCLAAGEMGCYNTIGIDLVAMNVNDLLCVGARPIALLNYIALECASKSMLREIFEGICTGARLARISIPGGETAILPGMIRGISPGSGFDLSGTAIGLVPPGRIITGAAVEEGDVLLGIASNGLHSNGYTLARKVLLARNLLGVETRFPGLDLSLGEELLRPTYIYIQEILNLFSAGIIPKAILNITGKGWLNLLRIESNARYEIDFLPSVPEIFEIIQASGNISDEEMYTTFNMGMGMSCVVEEQDVDLSLRVLNSFGKEACRIGKVFSDLDKSVVIHPLNLVLKGNK